MTSIIYQIREAEERAIAGIKKMFASAGILIGTKLVKVAFRLNQEFWGYLTLDMLLDTEELMKKCREKKDEDLVKNFISLSRKQTDGV